MRPSFRIRCVGACAMMLLAALLAFALVPNQHLAAAGRAIDLEQLVPLRFGAWELDARARATLVDPQQGDLESRLYQQVLSRTYVHVPSRTQVMLSVAYGENQSRSRDLHVPEVCYPAGGFRLVRTEDGELLTAAGSLPVRRIVAERLHRREPLTYWVVVGKRATTGAVRSKLIALSYGLTGTVPDGLIFRVSTVGARDDEAFALQASFVNELLEGLPRQDRERLTGVL